MSIRDPGIMHQSSSCTRQVRVAHLTSVHPRDDIRIFHKECKSLVGAGYEVLLVVADGLGNSNCDGVQIIDAGRRLGRLMRVFKTTKRVFEKSVELNADLYHLHDPELLPIGIRLVHLGKRVVFDSHEDVPKQILAKSYLNPFTLRILSVGFSIFERYACAKFDGVIAATPTINKKFLGINQNTININNYPLMGELNSAHPWSEKAAEVCYVGGIAGIRGIREVVRALALTRQVVTLNLAGTFSEPSLETQVREDKGWERVRYWGVVSRDGVRKVFEQSIAGLVTLHPKANYLDALPIKMFEYMSAGIPVIASDFPLWREIIEGNNCGLLVDPLDPSAIAAAIDFLVENPDIASCMGHNGRRAVEEKYNWQREEKKMLAFYQSLCAS